MVEIKTNDGVVLELASGTKMGLQFDSPFFTDVLGNAEYSLPIKLAGTGNNKIALDFFDRIKSSNRAVSLPNITLKDNGAKVAQDLALYIDSVTANANNGNCIFEGQLIGAKDAFLVWANSDTNGSTKKLADVELMKQLITLPTTLGGVYGNMVVAQWATDVTLNPSITPYVCFPCYYVPNWGGDGKIDALNRAIDFGINNTINCWDIANNGMVANGVLGSTGNFTVNDIVPMFKTYWVIEQIMTDAGYSIDYAPIFSDADFLKHYVFNTVSIVAFGDGYFDAGAFFVAASNHMPDILVTDWLTDIGILFGLKFIFKPNNKVDIIRFNDLMANNDYEDWTSKADANYIKTGVGADITGVELNYGGQDSENILSNAIQSLQIIQTAIDTGAYTVSNTVAGIGTRTAGDVILVKSNNCWYQSQSDGSNFFLGENLFRKKILDGKKVFSSNTISHNSTTNIPQSSTVWQLQTDASRSNISIIVRAYTITYPIPIPGTLYISYYKGANKQPFVSAIGIYHGLQNTLSGGNAIPFGSSNNYAPDSATKLSAWNLGWVGDEGLYETFWKQWVSLIAKMITVQFPMYLDANDLATLDYSKKKRINGVNYYLKSLKVEFPLDSGKQTGEFVLAEGIDL